MGSSGDVVRSFLGATAVSSEYLGTFSFSEKDKKTHELAARYHELTEAYDRTVCTGPIVNGEIRPVTAQESAMINRNAQVVLSELLRQAEPHKITAAELRTAIRRHKQ